jgi:hypothetical protein
MRVENSVIIDQPVHNIFDFITNLNNNTQWQAGILELEMISADLI